ncbi:ceramide glucosyltransferase, partial [Methylobacterium frigidaeris]
LLFIPIWLAAWVARDIVWRGNAMDIRTKPTRLGADAPATVP